MIFLYVLSGLVLISIIYILFAPVYIEIDSLRAVYRIRLHRIFAVAFFVNNDAAIIEIQAAFWRRRIDLSKIPERNTLPATANEKRKKTQRSFPFGKLLAVVKSFKVARLDATIDLGDMQWNGMLYPLFCWLSFKTGKNISINFEGRTSIVLQAENTIARMSRAFYAREL